MAVCDGVAALLRDKMPGAAHSVNTVGCDIQLVPTDRTVRASALATIDIEVLQTLLELPAVVRYNEAVLGWQPAVQLRRFNDSKGVQISDHGQLSENRIHAKFFKTMKIQVAGPKTAAEFLGVAEYLRGLVAAMLQRGVMLETMSIHNINSGIRLGMRLDRQLLTGQLLRLEEPWRFHDVRHDNVEYNPLGKKAYAGIKMRIVLESSTGKQPKVPKALMFQSGYVMIMACSYDVMHAAVRYICKLATHGVFEAARVVADNGADNGANGGSGSGEHAALDADEIQAILMSMSDDWPAAAADWNSNVQSPIKPTVPDSDCKPAPPEQEVRMTPAAPAAPAQQQVSMMSAASAASTQQEVRMTPAAPAQQLEASAAAQMFLEDKQEEDDMDRMLADALFGLDDLVDDLNPCV
jgi:hypothetical protein